MQYKTLALCGSAMVLAVAIACSKTPDNPTAPSSSQPSASDAAADGSTLKVSAPTPQSPINGAQPDSVALTAAKSSSTFGSSTPLSYQFELKNAAGATVCGTPTVVGGGTGSTVTFTPTGCTLEFDTNHTWRVRAAVGNSFGPWSAAATFKAPSGGYIRDNEVFDPLTNGRTVGDIVGPVTFIPGVGVRLEDFTSHIRYRLPRTMVTGEFSIVITGMATNTEGGKTKVMAMSEGLSDLITNERRFTIEKRGDPEGIVAWRFISHNSQIDTEGAERQFVAFDPNQAYLWTATWDGTFRVRVQRGGATGPVIYNQAKSYKGDYDPDPHYAFIGAPVGRSGPDAATVPGMIVRNVWISQRARPAGL